MIQIREILELALPDKLLAVTADEVAYLLNFSSRPCFLST